MGARFRTVDGFGRSATPTRLHAATVLALALAMDLAGGDPPNSVHPVAWLGRALAWGRERVGLRSAPALVVSGAVLVTGLVAAAAGAALRVEQWRPAWPWLRVGIEACLLKCAFSIRGLFAAVGGVEARLGAGDLAGARVHVGYHLVSRPTGDLAPGEVAAAAVESLAENLTDSVVAPLFFFTIGGLPAVWAYRAVNTADAMIGYRAGDLEYLGKPAARLDDALNWAPARLAAAAIAAGTALAGRPARRAWSTMRRDGGLTASPNAGRTMAAMAGALGVRLEKRAHYRLGDGPLPSAEDIAAARRIAGWAAGLVAVTAVLVCATLGWRRWRGA
jgi:adenosylcobinamide-phosphate synthase